MLYDEITKQMPMIIDIGEAHMAVSRASGTAQMIAFILLLDGSDNWSVELYGEIAKLLTSISNVESADVPFALKVSRFQITCDSLYAICPFRNWQKPSPKMRRVKNSSTHLRTTPLIG